MSEDSSYKRKIVKKRFTSINSSNIDANLLQSITSNKAKKPSVKGKLKLINLLADAQNHDN